MDCGVTGDSGDPTNENNSIYMLRYKNSSQPFCSLGSIETLDPA